MSKKIIDTISEMALPICESLDLELVDVEYVKEGKDWFLRIFIDSENGVDLEECGLFSEKISEVLDAVDPITEPYFLDVSSPGAERPLKKEKDFHDAIGKNIFVKTYEPIQGEKAYEGILLSYDEVELHIQYKIKNIKKEIKIPKNKVALARLAVTFS